MIDLGKKSLLCSPWIQFILVKYKWKQVGYAMETIRRVAATCIQDVGNRLYIFGKDVFGKFVSNMLTIYDAGKNTIEGGLTKF